MVSIYGLVGPISSEVRYVGKTNKTLEIRLLQHISESTSIINGSKRKKINKRYAWIR